MKDINDFSTSDLLEEIERRSRLPEQPKLKVVLRDTDIQSLSRIAQSYMEDIDNNREIDTNWAYEVLMEVFYGDEVFDYINSKG